MLSNPLNACNLSLGRSAKAAEQLWKEKFADESVRRDQVGAVNDAGESIGKAGNNA